jgi:iron(III) transport system permease protein
MERPVASAALAASPIDLARAAGVAVALLLLAVFIAWPVAAVGVHGLLVPAAWPWRVALDTLVVALAAALAASVAALLVALALTRIDVPGRTTIWQVFELGALMPPFIVPLGLLASGSSWRGLAAIAIGQALAFLPFAIVLMVRALAGVPAELEQAAEVLGARRVTILRRVTLGLAGPGIARAAVLVLGLCLADVTAPLLLGGDARVLTTVIVVAAAHDPASAVPGAVMLTGLAFVMASAAGAWLRGGVEHGAVLRRLERPTPLALRRLLGGAAWSLTVGLAGLWAMVPLGSLLRVGGAGVTLEHWTVVATVAGGALRNSVLLGLAVGAAGTMLALITAWAVERRRASVGRTLELLAWLPLAVPGVVAGIGYLLVFAPTGTAGTLLALVAVVACWELPVTSRVTRDLLARTDRSGEDAAISLGAGGFTTLTRVVAPTLRPAAGWIFGYLLAAAVLAVGTVIVLSPAGDALGALTMLTLAAAGATGAACAVATALLALAGGAVLLGRAIAGRQRGPMYLA